MVHAECGFVVGIHPSRTWVSRWWYACVHRLDLHLYSHPKGFFGNGVRTQVNSKGKISTTGGSEEGRTCDAASCRTASPTHFYRLSYSSPIKLETRNSNAVLETCTYPKHACSSLQIACIHHLSLHTGVMVVSWCQNEHLIITVMVAALLIKYTMLTTCALAVLLLMAHYNSLTNILLKHKIKHSTQLKKTICLAVLHIKYSLSLSLSSLSLSLSPSLFLSLSLSLSTYTHTYMHKKMGFLCDDWNLLNTCPHEVWMFKQKNIYAIPNKLHYQNKTQCQK